jgi:beta-glucanase (GH16 family)
MMSHYKLLWLIISLISLLLNACGTPGAIPPTATPLLPCQPTEKWKLIWQDEFNYAGFPDPSKWGYEVGYVRNNELQYFTKAKLENARVENGMLIIEARRDFYDGHEYTSASLYTKNHVLYGRIEVMAKLPTGRGMWPAIWTLGSNIKQVRWPTSGEIDIMENVGYEPDKIHVNVHTKAYNHVLGTNKGAATTIPLPYEEFHIYAIEWFEDRIDFYVDDTKVYTFENERTGQEAWPFDQPQYLIINAAVGGKWGGKYGVNQAIFPQRFYIDYVRIYEFCTEGAGAAMRLPRIPDRGNMSNSPSLQLMENP